MTEFVDITTDTVSVSQSGINELVGLANGDTITATALRIQTDDGLLRVEARSTGEITIQEVSDE